MPNKELIRELRELRKLLGELHRDARGDGHGACTCQATGAVCALHTQVRQFIIIADTNLRDAIILLNESAMPSTK